MAGDPDSLNGLASTGLTTQPGGSTGPSIPTSPTEPTAGSTTGPLVAPSPNTIPAKAVPAPPVDNSHTMHTRGTSGYKMPTDCLNLQASALSLLPKTYHGALIDPNWQDAMAEEFTAIQANNIWELVHDLLVSMS
jgi:hypothetical protein